MKKAMIAMLGVTVIVIAALLAQAQERNPSPRYSGPTAPFAHVVGTASTKVLADRTMLYPDTFAAGTVYSPGAVVKTTRAYYLCITTNAAGTAGTNTPSWLSGESSDGTNTWRAFAPGLRKGWVLFNAGTNRVYLGVGYAAVAGRGASLEPGGTWYEDSESKQMAIFAVGEGTATNGLLAGVEL